MEIFEFYNLGTNPNPEYKTQDSAGFDLAVDLEYFVNRCATKEELSENEKSILKRIVKKDTYSILLDPFERIMLPTGIQMNGFDNNYVLNIYPRSSTSFKKSVTLVNGVGVVDADYKGELNLLLINLSPKNTTISHGERLAQGVFSKIMRPEVFQDLHFEETYNPISNQERTGGIGSTGK